jgi:hypothetical protein
MTATVVTATGITLIVDRIDNTSTATSAWIGWGTGGSSTGGTATNADTGLKAAATEAWVAATLSQPDTDSNRFVATITAGTAKTVEEAIVFFGTSTATGTATNRCLVRASHGGQTLATGDSIQYTITMTATSV